MANQTPTLPNNNKEDALNPGEKINQEKLNGSYVDAGIDQLEALANDPRSHDSQSVNELEANPQSNTPTASWRDSTAPQPAQTKGRFFTRRRVGIIGGGGGIIGIAIFFISGFGSLGGLVINLGEQATDRLDSRSPLVSNRLLAVIDHKMVGSVTSGSCDVIKIACRFSRLSNVFLNRLDDYGIQAFNGDPSNGGTPVEKKPLGYPNERPTHFTYTDSKGNRLVVPAADFVKTLRSNPEFRRAFTTAFNSRYWAYASSAIKKFYKNSDVDRSGKTVNEIDPEKPEESIKNIATDADKNNPVRGATDAEAKNSAASEVIEEALEDEVKKSSLHIVKGGGDPIITIGSLACVAANTPAFVTNVVRLYQMRQLIAVAANIVLVSSSMIKAGDMQPETMAVIGGLITAVALLPDGTKTKSAMDSFAVKNVLFGDATSSSSVYKKIIPGGAVATQFSGINTIAGDPAFKEACATITSPQAQAAVTALEAGIGAGTAGTGAVVFAVLKALGKVVVTVGIADIIIKAAAEPISAIIKSIPPEQIAALLSNPDIENAKNEDLGNVIGAGLRFFFSNSCLATGCAPLSTSQIVAYSDFKRNDQIAYEEQDRIGRSPFDISSSSTFLGKIAANYYKDGYVAASFGQTILSTLGYALRQPLSLFSDTSYADTNDMLAQCSHATEFGVDASVGVGPFSDICAGFPPEYLTSTDNVLASVSGMIDENTGEPLADKDVAMTLNECGQASLLNAKGCVIDSQERANLSLYSLDSEALTILDSDGATSDSGESILDENISLQTQVPTETYNDTIAQLFQSYQSVSTPVNQPSIPETATSSILALAAERRTVKDRDETVMHWIPVVG